MIAKCLSREKWEISAEVAKNHYIAIFNSDVATLGVGEKRPQGRGEMDLYLADTAVDSLSKRIA
jgi:hypothetical protein